MDSKIEEIDNKVEANRKAIEFLQSIDFKCISKTVFRDDLATQSDDGKIIGNLRISVEETIRDEEVCYLVYSYSHNTLEGNSIGSSVTAYISRGLKTLELIHHEYSEAPDKTIEKKSVFSFDGSQYIVKKTITKGQEVSEIERIFPVADMTGFISEGAAIIMERIMCLRQEVPENASFITLDTSLNLAAMTYEKLLDSKIEVEGNHLKTLGIQREIISDFYPRVQKQLTFLVDGHLASQVILDSPYSMHLIKIPEKDEERLEGDEIKSERQDLHWKEDMEMQSYFMERKDELINDHQTYLRHKPELQAMMKDFLQFVLLRKPDDICSFAASYFGSFSIKETPRSLPLADTSSK